MLESGSSESDHEAGRRSDDSVGEMVNMETDSQYMTQSMKSSTDIVRINDVNNMSMASLGDANNNQSMASLGDANNNVSMASLGDANNNVSMASLDDDAKNNKAQSMGTSSDSSSQQQS